MGGPSLQRTGISTTTRVLVLAVVVAASGCNFIRWKRDRFVDRFHGAGLSQKTAVLGEDTLSYWEGGSGSPVVLVHGYGLAALWHFNEQIESLSRYHRLIVPDLLWSGGSTSTLGDFGVRHQARAILALLDRLGIETADVVGLSYGGFVAWMMAAYYPERVTSLVMIGSPGATYTSDDYRAMCKRHHVEHAADLFLPRRGEDVARLLSIAFQNPPWVPGFAGRQAVKMIYDRNRTEIRALMDGALVELADSDDIPTPRAPTLLIWGDNDPVFPLELSTRVLHRLEGHVTLQVIGNSHHAPNLEHPEQVNAMLLEFLHNRPEPRRSIAASPNPPTAPDVAPSPAD